MSKNEIAHTQGEKKSNRIVTDFYPAHLKKTKSEGYIIEFRYRDPISNEMKRGRHYVNRLINNYQKKAEGIEHARRICFEITEKLRNGWSPAMQSDNQRLYTPILKLRDYYINDKKKDLRAASMASYSSVTKLFCEWIEDTNRTNKVTGSFKREDAICYLDFIASKDVSNRTYNNTLKGIRAMWTWALEHCYCVENPFLGIKTKKKEHKKRILIDAESRKRIRVYLIREDPMFLIACLLVYNSAMRPKEISNIKIEDIDINGRYIHVTEDNAKNGKARCATLTQELIDMIRPFTTMPGSYFLFGMNKEMKPDKKRIPKSRFTKKWIAMRNVLNLPKEMQMYSLRDTGMVDLLHAGVNELSVQQHYDHSSLQIQSIYTNHFDPNLNETIFQNAPKF